MSGTNRLVLLTSNDKTPGESSSNSNFVIDLKETYLTQGIIRVLIKDVSVPNVFYNVRDGTNGSQNNQLTFTETGQPQEVVSIPQGQYTSGTLLPAVQAAMNAVLVSGTVALTQDTLTQVYIFTFTGTTAIINKGSLGTVMGVTSNIGPSGLITSQSVPDLNGYQVVYVHSKDIGQTHGIDGGFGLISTIEDISFNNVPFGNYAFRQNNDDTLSTILYDVPRNLSRIAIVLRDDKGNVLDIGSHQLTIILKVFY